jgi:hypothetical protein
MEALAKVLKPTDGPMEVELNDEQTQADEEQAEKEFEAKVEAMKAPTPDELATRVCQTDSEGILVGADQPDECYSVGSRNHSTNDRLQLRFPPR